MTIHSNALLKLPADLTVWVDEHTLASLTLEVTSTLAHDMLRFESPNSRWHYLRPQMLLGLLTYCYARGIFSSNEISDQAQMGGMIRYLSAYTLPDEQQLKAFRRHWRHLLRQSLVGLFQLVWRKHYGVAGDTAQPKNWAEGFCPIHEWYRFLDEEADRRIHQAVEFDTIEDDF